MQKLLKSIQLEFPSLKFRPGTAFYWAPETGEVFYKSGTSDCKHGKDSLSRVQFGSKSSTEAERTLKVREPRSTEFGPKCADCESRNKWALLHEVSHALLHHKQYNTDLELLQLEVAAWDHAEQLAKQFNLSIDANYVQDCLDTYRNWLHARSTCPSCTTRCLQQADQRHYRCHNCHTTWRVSASRFCRPYRAVRSIAQPTTIFASHI